MFVQMFDCVRGGNSLDAQLEASRTPLDQVERLLRLERRNSRRAIARNDISTVQQRNRHVLAVTRITNDHLVIRLEAAQSQIVHLEALMAALLVANHRCVADQRVMDTRVRDQVGLKLVQIDVQCTIETEGACDRRYDLGNQSVQVLVVGAWDVEVSAADVVDRLVVNEEGAVRVLDSGVSGQDGVVGLHHGSRGSWRWVDGEFKLALLAVVGG